MPKIYDDREKVRESLLAAGQQLFSFQGLKKTRVEDLCLATSMAKGTFYHFFTSKEDLFLAVFFRAQEALFHRMTIKELPLLLAVSDDRLSRMEALIRRFLDLALEEPILRRVRDREDAEVFRSLLDKNLQSAFDIRDKTWSAGLLKSLAGTGISLSLDPETGGRLIRHLYLTALEAGSTADPLVRFLIQACAVKLTHPDKTESDLSPPITGL